MSQHGFLGVPLETFEQAGREQLIALLENGLRPESRVLEIGCGCLRIAYWLVRFLEPGGYCGIEPAQQRVAYGLRYLFKTDELERKRPRFDFNAEFNTSVFGQRFDFFLARSIWTHASKPQIESMLNSFTRDTEENGVMLASYLPAQSAKDDYRGNSWVGTSHESNVPGVIRHRLDWIEDQCRARSLQVDRVPGIDCDSQFWLTISRRAG